MVYIEMSRDEAHGGDAWGFSNCVWAPTLKYNGSSWPFWTKVKEIRQGDTIVHLRGKTPSAYFVGYSIASGDGFETSRRPPNPESWDFADKFCRADLTQFTPFHKPINLLNVFASRKTELEVYFEKNRKLGTNGKNIFFVKQSNRLQCLNGAYLSEVDEDLFNALFDFGTDFINRSPSGTPISVETGIQISAIYSRLGQTRFSNEIKNLYGNRCCFPDCPISDARFLVGSHIARWSDNVSLRGDLGNGLCLLHDKAFEMGLFTVDENFRIYVNPREKLSDSSVVRDIFKYHGRRIRVADIHPLEDAILEHWIRVGVEP
jgi:putative restriction endonuclease